RSSTWRGSSGSSAWRWSRPMPDRLAAAHDGIERAGEPLRSGELVAFPTDTVYGTGSRAGDAGALARIFEAKRRDPDKAVAWLIGSPEAVAEAGFSLDERALKL